MDEKYLEMAEAREQMQRDRALYEAQQRAAPETHPDFDGKHCIECDVEIHPGRLALKKVRCIDCQEATEKRNAHTRK